MSLASIALAAACIEAATSSAQQQAESVSPRNTVARFDPSSPGTSDQRRGIVSSECSPMPQDEISAAGVGGIIPFPHSLQQLPAAPRVVSFTDAEDASCVDRRGLGRTENEDGASIKGHDAFSSSPASVTVPIGSIDGSGAIVVSDHDVLCGRGGETNHHPGNVYYRRLVKSLQREYLDAKRRDKPRIARRIVEAIRDRNPPGRFLKRDGDGRWNEIGLTKAREKTSQALREGAPEIRTSSYSTSSPPAVAMVESSVSQSDTFLAMSSHEPCVVSGMSSSDEEHDCSLKTDRLSPTCAPAQGGAPIAPVQQQKPQFKVSSKRGPRLFLFKARMMEESCADDERVSSAANDARPSKRQKTNLVPLHA